MITGDNMEIAVSIAKIANIIPLNEDFRALTGNDFYQLIGGIICEKCDFDISRCECPRTVEQAKAIYKGNHGAEFYEEKLYREKIKNLEEFSKTVKYLKVGTG